MRSEKKILFVCRDLSKSDDGGICVAKRNLEMLRSQAVVDVIQICLSSFLSRLVNVISLQSYGDNKKVRLLLKVAAIKQYDFIFFDGSLYGPYVRFFKHSGFKTIVFYHNIEYNYYRSKWTNSRNIFNFLMIYYIRYIEKISTSHASHILVLNQRDNTELKRLYKYEADLILPTSFKNDNNGYEIIKEVPSYCLFVGSNFFANVEGITWFIENVSPFITCELWIIGSVCDALTFVNKDLYPNVRLLGFVDHLQEYYDNAICVISPIFSGSGLKTKTIEALKFGKFILGTREAFEGVTEEIVGIGKLCTEKEEYIKEINLILENKSPLFNEYSYTYFRDHFSNEVVFAKFWDFVNRLKVSIK